MSSKTFWAKENGVHGLKELTEARFQARLASGAPTPTWYYAAPSIHKAVLDVQPQRRHGSTWSGV